MSLRLLFLYIYIYMTLQRDKLNVIKMIKLYNYNKIDLINCHIGINIGQCIIACNYLYELNNELVWKNKN